MVASRAVLDAMRVDTDLLSSVYTERLQSLRSRAEENGISKSGSVEVLRARLISNLVLEQACHDPDGEIYHDEVRVEVRLEVLSPDGRKTLSLERLVAMSEYQRAIVALMMDWENMVRESSREVPKDHPTDVDAPSFL